MTSNIKQELIDYYKKVVEINGIDYKIENRKDELMPTMVSSLSGMPRGNKTTDQTYDTVVKWEEDDTIKELYSRKKELKLNLKDINALLLNLTTSDREFIHDYYSKGKGLGGRVVADKYRYTIDHTYKKSRAIMKKLTELYEEFYT